MSGRAPSLNRQILALAVPALGALVAEPLFVLADSAIVGQLGTAQLAGLSVASTLVQTVVGLMIFLSYSTTPAVARHLGAGRLPEAYRVGRDGIWVALAIGVGLALLGWAIGEPVLRALGADGVVLGHARAYLSGSLPGLPAMLMVLAAVGVLRGLQDTRTPLWVAGIAAVANVGVNWVLVYPVGLGVLGSAIGTSIVQWAMAIVLVGLVARGARRHAVGLRAERRGATEVLRVGSWLMVRTAAMRVGLLATLVVVARQGPTNLAAYQLVMGFFGFLAFALDSLAIAAQALLGKELGARDLTLPAERLAVRQLMRRLVLWSVGFGVVTGVLTPLVGAFGGFVFTSDPAVQHLFWLGLLVVAVGQPIASYVFILDGVLIGAQDFRYLAIASVACVTGYALMLWPVGSLAGGGAVGFVWLWASYAVGYLGFRAVTLGLRSRSDVWIRP